MLRTISNYKNVLCIIGVYDEGGAAETLNSPMVTMGNLLDIESAAS